MDAAHGKHPQHRSTARLVDGEVQDVAVGAVVLGSIVATLTTRSDLEDELVWCCSGPDSMGPLGMKLSVTST